jgi:hypothetical protein
MPKSPSGHADWHPSFFGCVHHPVWYVACLHSAHHALEPDSGSLPNSRFLLHNHQKVLVALALTGAVDYQQLDVPHPIALGVKATGVTWLAPVVEIG